MRHVVVHNGALAMRQLDIWHYFFCLYHRLWTDYIGEFEIIDDHRAGKIVVELRGRLNKCGVISPRFDVKGSAIESWISNLLPSRLVSEMLFLCAWNFAACDEITILWHRLMFVCASFYAVRSHRPYNFSGYHGPGRSATQENRRQNPWFLLLRA